MQPRRSVFSPRRQLLTSGNRWDAPDEDETNTSAYGPASVGKVLLQSADPIHLFSFWPITQILCTPPFCSLQSSGCSSCKPNKYVASALFFLENTPGGSTCGDLRSGSSHTNMMGRSCTCGKNVNMQCCSRVGSPTATGHVHMP